MRGIKDKLKVRNVLIDVDGTLTYERNNFLRARRPGGHNYPQMLCAQMLGRKKNITEEKALELLRKAESLSGREDPFYAVRKHPEWGVTYDDLWAECVAWQDKRLFFYRDAVHMLEELQRLKFALYIASNNGTDAILMKLSREKFASRDGSPYFKGLFGDDKTGCSKAHPEFYIKLFEMAGISPAESVMIGDNVEQDCHTPRKMGFNNSIVVNRRQCRKIIRKDAFYVNSLRCVMDILALH